MNKNLNTNLFDFSDVDILTYDDLPKYDLFLSQVIEFLNENFPEEKYTSNIVQNYIKNEVISKPTDGKKRGYEKIHFIQLVLLSYMRPILTTEEIKKVFSLAFNEINDRDDDILSWEDTFKLFNEFQKHAFEDITLGNANESKLDELVSKFNLKDSDVEKVKTFLSVMSLIAISSSIKKTAAKIINNFGK